MSHYSPYYRNRGDYDSKRWKTGRFPTVLATSLAIQMDGFMRVLNHDPLGGGTLNSYP